MVLIYIIILTFFPSISHSFTSSDEFVKPASQELQEPFPCQQCDYVVAGYKTDGKILRIKPGDIICLSAHRVYNRIVLTNIEGSADNPVIIRNCGGVAKICAMEAFGMKFQDSKHFLLTGDGTNEKYGITISTEKGFFLTMEHFTTDFEVSRVEIRGGCREESIDGTMGFAGIGVKTSPYEDCDLFTDSTRQAWTMRNIRIHDNYIHDIGGEGLYIGHGFYKGRQEKRCPPGTITYSHAIKGVRIYNNIIENVGFDGIQIKNADEDVKVYDNVVRNYGTHNHNAHNEGLFIGEGTTGSFYGNIIDTGTGNGCRIQGIGNLDIHDNLFISPGKYGIYAAHGEFVVRWPDGYFNIHNNTVFQPQRAGFVFYNNDGGPKKIVNNLVIQASGLLEPGSDIELAGNVLSNDPVVAGTLARHRVINIGNTGIQNEKVRQRFREYLNSPAEPGG